MKNKFQAILAATTAANPFASTSADSISSPDTGSGSNAGFSTIPAADYASGKPRWLACASFFFYPFKVALLASIRSTFFLIIFINIT